MIIFNCRHGLCEPKLYLPFLFLSTCVELSICCTKNSLRRWCTLDFFSLFLLFVEVFTLFTYFTVLDFVFPFLMLVVVFNVHSVSVKRFRQIGIWWLFVYIDDFSIADLSTDRTQQSSTKELKTLQECQLVASIIFQSNVWTYISTDFTANRTNRNEMRTSERHNHNKSSQDDTIRKRRRARAKKDKEKLIK